MAWELSYSPEGHESIRYGLELMPKWELARALADVDYGVAKELEDDQLPPDFDFNAYHAEREAHYIGLPFDVLVNDAWRLVVGAGERDLYVDPNTSPLEQARARLRGEGVRTTDNGGFNPWISPDGRWKVPEPVVPMEFVSVWDDDGGSEVLTSCKVDTYTGEVVEIEVADGTDHLEGLKEELVRLVRQGQEDIDYHLNRAVEHGRVVYRLDPRDAEELHLHFSSLAAEQVQEPSAPKAVARVRGPRP